jgi:hypothetical protein
MRRIATVSFLSLAATAFLMGGCFGEEVPVELSYARPAKVQIPERVKRIAVADFTGGNDYEKRWGQTAAAEFSGELDRCNREFKRYELVDRDNLAKVLKEQDLAIMTGDEAVSAGKLAQVQALVFGNIRVQARDERRQRQQYDWVTKQNKTIWYTHRFVLVSVKLDMTDVDTSKVLHTFTDTKEYDSDKDKDNPTFLRMIGLGSDNPPPLDETVHKIVAAVVVEFARQICPHRVAFQEKLEAGGCESVTTGNKMAKAKDYAGALDAYTLAMRDKPDDDGAVFNAGVMNEALGNSAEAERLYTRAIDMGKKGKYIEARQRVRRETQSNGK